MLSSKEGFPDSTPTGQGTPTAAQFIRHQLVEFTPSACGCLGSTPMCIRGEKLVGIPTGPVGFPLAWKRTVRLLGNGSGNENDLLWEWEGMQGVSSAFRRLHTSNSAFTLATCCRTSSATTCRTCGQCERTRTQVAELVAQLVASVNGSIEIHGEYKFSNKFRNLLPNLLSNMWPV